MSMTVELYAVPATEVDRVAGDPETFARFTEPGNQDVTAVSLEKAWHGLHYLLTGAAWQASGPRALILAGGREVPDSDAGYGDARIFSPEAVAEIHQELNSISDDQLWSAYDAAAMTAAEIYPLIWDEPEEELREEYLMYFNDLKTLVAGAATSGDGILVFLA